MANNLSCPIPENINPLYITNFIFSVHKLPALTFFAQKVNLPSVTLGQANLGTPLSDIPFPGDKLEFSTFTVDFTVDEKMMNYLQLSEWIMALGYPENNQQFTKFINKQENMLTEHLKTVSDATLGILSSSMSPVATYTFVDCFPVSISGFSFDTTVQDAETVRASATFAYNYFTVQTMYG